MTQPIQFLNTNLHIDRKAHQVGSADVESNDVTPHTCDACGAELQPGNRFCANCGAAVIQAPQVEPPLHEAEPSLLEEEIDSTPSDTQVEPEPHSEPDASTQDTREFATTRYTSANYPEPDDEHATHTSTPSVADDPGWESSETTVPPERGNRTLWIILGIIAVIVLICCCILPLGLLAIANWDTGFQDELRSTVGTFLG